MNHVFVSEFLTIKIVERNGIVSNANISDKITHLTISRFINVGKDTVLKVRFINLFLVSADLFIHTVAEDVLVTEHILNFTLVNGHLLRISVLQGTVLVHIVVLRCIILTFREFGEFFLNSACAHLIEVLAFERLGLEHVHEVALFFRGELGEERHHLRELLLVSFVLLVSSLG